MTPGDGIAKDPATLSVREQADLVLRLPPAERLKFLLQAPKPMALVRALPDGDFYLTVREVGPLDALPILELGSASQIEHVVDLESWRGDRFDPLRCGAWVALLAEAGEATLKRFVRAADDPTLVLLLRDWARVLPLEIDHEEPTRGHGITETGDERGFVSPDGAHLFAPERSEHAVAVRRFAEALYRDSRDHYLGLVHSAKFDLPSELEENGLRWRASRLEEHGYPPIEEALSIYAPPERRPDAVFLAPPPPEIPEALAAPRTALRVLGPEGSIAPALEAVPAEDRERVLFGLTALANRVLVADHADPGSVETHRRALEKAGGYVGIALAARGAAGPAAAARVLTEVPAIELFREGYAAAAELSSRARRMLRDGWARGPARAVELLDSPLRERMGALLAPRPLYVEADPEGSLTPRDFRSLGEIEETRLTVDLIDVLAQTLLARRGTTAAAILGEERRPFEDTPRFSTLLLTLLAWQTARGRLEIDRLPQDVLADFLRTTASRRTAPPEAPARALDRLLEALGDEVPQGRRAAAALKAFGASCLERLAIDCGGLEPGTPVTPRVVGCLRIA
jgi:hypothetical protein